MSVCLLVIRDGRDFTHARSLLSVSEYLPEFDHVVTVDDSDHRLGFAGAIDEGWRMVLETGADFVFHLEADFVFHQVIQVDRMISVMRSRPWIVQVSLKRQPWNEREVAAGGIVEADPDDFVERFWISGERWVEHRRYWTTNPSVYSTSMCRRGWPLVERSEGAFTAALLADRPHVRFAIWGRKFDPPLVEHIGMERTGVGY